MNIVTINLLCNETHMFVRVNDLILVPLPVLTLIIILVPSSLSPPHSLTHSSPSSFPRHSLSRQNIRAAPLCFWSKRGHKRTHHLCTLHGHDATGRVAQDGLEQALQEARGGAVAGLGTGLPAPGVAVSHRGYL